MPICPFYRRAEKKGGYPVYGYCEGYRSGKLRIPTLGEMRGFCVSDCYHCPVYLFRYSEEVGAEKNSNVA